MPFPTTRFFTLEDLEEAAVIIRNGGLVVFPTETVYGLGANALLPAAVEGIFRAKGRPQDNPLIVHIASLAQIGQVAAALNRAARVLLEQLAPGPLTVILPRHPGLAAAVTAGKDTVGVRIPGSEPARRFLAACGVPVAAPSANRSGRPSPTNFAMACSEMQGRADAIIQGPEAELGLESTIVWPEHDSLVHVLRPGGIDLERLRQVFAAAGMKVELRVAGHAVARVAAPTGGARLGSGAAGDPAGGAIASEAPTGQELPAAPGTRYRHYSPAATVRLFSNAEQLAELLAALGQDRERSACTILGAELMAGGEAAHQVGASQEQATRQEAAHQAAAHQAAAHQEPAVRGSASCDPVSPKPAGREPGSAGRPASPTAVQHRSDYHSLEDYARHLYRELVEADHRGSSLVLAWLPPPDGLGLALRDRLERAAGKTGH